MHLEPRANPLLEAFNSIFNNLTTEPQPKFPAAWEVSGRKIEFVRKIVEAITNYPFSINQLRVECQASRAAL
jgi:hypothetical protein